MYIGRLNFNSNTVGTAISLSGGGSFIGVLSTSRTTFLDNEAITKLYADTAAANATLPNATLYLSKDGSLPMTGPLVMSASATTNNHAVNKTLADSYITTNVSNAVVTVNQTTVDGLVNTNLASNSNAVIAGDIVRLPTATTPTGFLRCNGAIVLKSSYGALYTVVGDQYNVTPMTNGNGQPWRLQAGFNTSQTGDITGWTFGTNLPITLDYFSTIVTKNRVYIGGGTGGAGASNNLYTCPINSDGTLGTWSLDRTLSTYYTIKHTVMTSTRIYLIGGGDSVTGLSASVFYAPINSDGTLGTFITDTPLPATIFQSRLIVTKNRVYLLGGYINSIASSTVYTASIDYNGIIGIWVTGTPLPSGYELLGTGITTTNYAYIIGSAIGADILKALINSDGTLGSWTPAAPLPVNIAPLCAVVTKNRIYILGNNVNNVSSSTVYTASIDSAGVIGSFTTQTPINMAKWSSNVIITSSKIYLLGGQTSSNWSADVIFAPFTGGLNDYTTLNVTGTPTDSFVLPNLTTQDAATTGVYSYIKV